MNILQINNFHYRKGGSETVYFNTIDLLEKRGNKIISFSINHTANITSEWSKYFVENPNFLNKSVFGKIKSIGKFFYNSEAKKKLTQLILKEKPQIAQLHLFYGGLTSSILKILKKKRFQLWSHYMITNYCVPYILFLLQIIRFVKNA